MDASHTVMSFLVSIINNLVVVVTVHHFRSLPFFHPSHAHCMHRNHPCNCIVMQSTYIIMKIGCIVVPLQ